jgi:hypothetical protein
VKIPAVIKAFSLTPGFSQVPASSDVSRFSGFSGPKKPFKRFLSPRAITPG